MDDATSLTKALTNVASITILVVQTDVWVRALITEALREQGYTCIEVAKAGEALDVLHSQARVDLLLTSLRMRGEPSMGTPSWSLSMQSFRLSKS